MQKCVGCRFYDRDQAQSGEKGVRWGQCRRTGPIVHPLSAKTYMVEGIWPHVRDDDWCGEWTASGRPDTTTGPVIGSLMTQPATAPRTQPMTPMLSPADPLLDGRPAAPTLMRTPVGSD